MLYTDKEFTPENLCAEVEERFNMDIYFEENSGIHTYHTVDGSLMSKEIALFIYQVYEYCDGERSRDYVRVFTNTLTI